MHSGVLILKLGYGLLYIMMLQGGATDFENAIYSINHIFDNYPYKVYNKALTQFNHIRYAYGMYLSYNLYLRCLNTRSPFMGRGLAPKPLINSAHGPSFICDLLFEHCR